MGALPPEEWQREIETLRRENTELKTALESRRFQSVETALEQGETLYRRLIETAWEGIWFIDAEASTVFVNERMAQMLGYTVEEMLGRRLPEFMDETAHPELARYSRQCRQGIAGQYDFCLRRKDGSELWALIATSPMMGKQGEFLGGLGMVVDITERKRAEEALQSAHQKLRFHVENSPLAVIEWNPENRIMYWSEGAERTFGWRAEEVLGKRPEEWKFVHEEDADAILDVERRLMSGKEPRVVWHNRNYTKSGNILHCEWYNSVLMDSAGRVVSILSQALDVTERKQLEAQLLHAQKMESIGRLAGGVAHDFNNMLTAILGYSELIQETLPPDGEALQYMQNLRSAAQRSAHLTAQLLAFARRQVIAPKVENLNALVLEVSKILRHLIGEPIELVTVLKSDLGQVRVDAGQFGQILVNLAINARDAMPEGGKLTIETDNVTLGDEYTRHYPGVQPGESVLLAVSDTGFGMSKEDQAHIFEPFFTTKEQGRGTGLGLATCYGIVKQNGGHIWVYSELGRGTTFKIYLPRVEEPRADAPTQTLQDASAGRETVLLVEDEPLVRDYAARTLRSRGYLVLEACDGEEALKRAAEFPAKIDLLFTDVVMPQMSGTTLMARLQEARPDIKTLYASGYTENTIIKHGILTKDAFFLQKPYLPETLAHKIRAALEGKAAEG